MPTIEFAKFLRRNMTDAERRLWYLLRSGSGMFRGEKFRRQQIIGPYIVDFVNMGTKLVVEADGGQHNQSEKDKQRDAFLKSRGYTVLRFWNNEIFKETNGVLETIQKELERLKRENADKSAPWK
jgi:very-short-patch-repair endonuclease